MNDRIRCLSRPDHQAWPKTQVLPSPVTKAGMEVRNTLSQFLEATLMRPLRYDEQQRQQQIETALETMTWSERIAIEIEMQQRAPTVHSFDYDPLKCSSERPPCTPSTMTH